MADIRKYWLIRNSCLFMFLFNDSFSITHNTSTYFEWSSSSQNSSTVVESNFSWQQTSRKELIYSPDNQLIEVPEDQLPLEYWVPVKTKLRYWPHRTISVRIGRGFTFLEARTIWDALEAMSKSIGNCIRFVRKAPYDMDFLYFRKAPT